jgi:DNA-binding transcriptional LysR family regulator
LTETGRRFLPYATEMIDLYAQSKQAVQDADEPSGQLVIGASESVLIYWIPEFIMTFRKKYPQVDLTLKCLDYQRVTDQLQQGDIDAALLVETVNWQLEPLTIHKLKQERLSLVQSAQPIWKHFQTCWNPYNASIHFRKPWLQNVDLFKLQLFLLFNVADRLLIGYMV